jgi:hypothetical protein
MTTIAEDPKKQRPEDLRIMIHLHISNDTNRKDNTT